MMMMPKLGGARFVFFFLSFYKFVGRFLEHLTYSFEFFYIDWHRSIRGRYLYFVFVHEHRFSLSFVS